jgi:UDP-N-acetylmuramoyl-tripeptide--D-alanyl-D-alanine ligase
MGLDGFKLDLISGKEKRRIRFPFLLESTLYNLLAALGVISAFGLTLETVENAIHDLKPVAKRGLCVRLAKNTVLIDDSYNSNPRALESALRSFAALPARRRVAVLGDMLELGETGPAFHEEAGEHAARTAWDLLVTIGSLSRHIANGARSAGMSPSKIHSFATSEEAALNILPLLQEGDLILVKGSRGIQTEKVAEAIITAFKET